MGERLEQYYLPFEWACCILKVWFMMVELLIVTSSHGDREKGYHWYHWCSRHVIFCVIISYRSRQTLSFVIVIDGEGMLPMFFFFCNVSAHEEAWTPPHSPTRSSLQSIALPASAKPANGTELSEVTSSKHTIQLFFFYLLFKGIIHTKIVMLLSFTLIAFQICMTFFFTNVTFWRIVLVVVFVALTWIGLVTFKLQKGLKNTMVSYDI